MPSSDLNPLMKKALNRVAFLPWGLLVDRWRWGVYSGQIKPEDFNRGWWELRRKYQGIDAAIPRTEADFDPGAKYHIPANVPYTRYFLADILQFQFHRGLCRNVLGFKGPLNQCSIYGNKEAGARIDKMMRMGASRPWPEALKVLTGEEAMDAGAIAEYFAPLHLWLKEQNKGKVCGW
jgi:peptidyl-dipeptidase A